MPEVSLFVEDYGHEIVVATLVKRIAQEFGIDVSIRPLSVRGGFGKVETELKEYVKALTNLRERLPDLVIVATDANCAGIAERQKRLQKVIEPIKDRIILAVPDPHVERWLLLDSRAFKAVLGEGCVAPDQKCDRDRYKQLLAEAVQSAGQIPLLGGMEHAEDIVREMRLTARRPRHELDAFVYELRTWCKRWGNETT